VDATDTQHHCMACVTHCHRPFQSDRTTNHSEIHSRMVTSANETTSHQHFHRQVMPVVQTHPRRHAAFSKLSTFITQTGLPRAATTDTETAPKAQLRTHSSPDIVARNHLHSAATRAHRIPRAVHPPASQSFRSPGTHWMDTTTQRTICFRMDHNSKQPGHQRHKFLRQNHRILLEIRVNQLD